MDRRLFTAMISIAVIMASVAIAQTSPPIRMRGTIMGLEGNVLTVRNRNGENLEIALNDPLTVLTVKNVNLNAITPNDYVGIATRTEADGKLTALEVLVFPEANRGAGEGYSAWDLEPGSMMTNGTVKGAVTATSGRELSISYHDRSNTIFVPPTAPVVTFAPAERTDMKAGAPIFISVTKKADGKLATGRVVVGKDGVAPPM